MSKNNNERQSEGKYDESILNLGLDEYYERYVTPPDNSYWRNHSLKAQRRRQYCRTHYFSPDYFKRAPSKNTKQLPSAATPKDEEIKIKNDDAESTAKLEDSVIQFGI